MRDRLTRLETTQEHLVQVQERVEDTLDKMRRLLTLSEGSRRRLEDLEDEVDHLEDQVRELNLYVKTKWALLTGIILALSALMNWLFQVL